MKPTVLRTRRAESVLDELENMRRRVTGRAYEIFRTRGSVVGCALDDWLAAERQAIWKPAIDVCETDRAFVVEAALAGVEPRTLDIRVTQDTLLIQAETAHTHGEQKGVVHVCEFQPGRLFRAVRFPKPIDPDAVKAEYRNGLLRLTAAVAAEKPATTVEVSAA